MATDEDDMEELKTPPQGMVEVFDPEGKRHVMLRLNAHDMVQHCGWHWSLAKPSTGAPSVHVIVSKKDAPAITEDKQERIDLNTLDQDQLIAFAKEHFDMDFTKSVSKEDILAAIIQEQTA